MERFPIQALILIGLACLAFALRTGSADVGMFGLASLTGGIAYAAHVYRVQLRAFLDRIGGHR
jgi:uncharacterized membrane protein HdeD (DUF308 family)